MPYKLVVSQLNLGDTGETFIPGLGSFTNGVHYITDEQEQAFRVFHTVDEGSPNEEGVMVPKFVPGPSLVDRNLHAITVEYVDSIPSDDPPASRGTNPRPVVSPAGGTPSDKESDGGES